MPQPLNDIAAAIAETAASAEPHLIALRRDIHAHPELAFQEHRTAALVASELTRLGIAHETGVGRTGVVGTIHGARPGPTLAIRGDMDALPIAEQTGLPFASENAGLMHACGHDVHTTTLLGTAEILHRLVPNLAGTIKLVFQPAEEILAGAAEMIAAGALDGVDMALGFHNHPDMPVGSFASAEGAAYAACDRFRILITGRSGHAAYPHAAIDPIVAAAHLIATLQTVVSREIGPLEPCVVTVGAIHAGTVHNIIPDTCELLGTVRTLRPETRAAAEAALRRHCEGHAMTFRTNTEMAWLAGVPPTRNDDGVRATTLKAVREHFADALLAADSSMGAEDFSLFAERVPSCVLRIGSGTPGRRDALHNSGYQPDEACIALGAQALARAAVELLA